MTDGELLRELLRVFALRTRALKQTKRAQARLWELLAAGMRARPDRRTATVRGRHGGVTVAVGPIEPKALVAREQPPAAGSPPARTDGREVALPSECMKCYGMRAKRGENFACRHGKPLPECPLLTEQVGDNPRVRRLSVPVASAGGDAEKENLDGQAKA